ncbi:hypothetical protein Tco_1316859 [Tanacetum coccineum]
MRDMRQEMGDTQAELLALREQRRRARQRAPYAKIPDHQDASGDADSHELKDYAETGLLWSLSVFIRSTVIWERVHDFQLGVESYQQKVNLTVPTITFPGIEKYKVFSIVSEPVYDIIYKNNKKEKRVMRHQKVHKFCDSRLKRVLEGLKSYNNNVKHGYVTPSKEDDEYLQLFKEVIEERLKHRDQMRRWEMYVGRPLGSRRERPE